MDAKLLDLWACPHCLTHPEKPKDMPRGALAFEPAEGTPTALRCRQCGRRYPIENETPNLTLDAATLPDIAKAASPA